MSASVGRHEGEGSGWSLTREGWIKATAAAVALGVGAAVCPGSSSAAADDGRKGLPTSGYFVQHAVFKVPDMDDEVKFFTEGLGMKIVRQREVNGARNVFVAYGEESLENKDGGYFSLELVYDPKAPPGYTSGGPFQYLGLTLDSTLATVAYKVDAAGGTVVPHWFGTKDFVEVTSPSGTTVRIKEGKRRDPFSVVAFGTQYSDKATAYFHDVLGMKEQDAGLLKILGPLAGDALRLSGYDKGGVSVALNPVDNKIFEGGTFGKLAVLTRDTKALAEKVAASGGAKKTGGGDVLFAGEVPGIGTKSYNLARDALVEAGHGQQQQLNNVLQASQAKFFSEFLADGTEVELLSHGPFTISAECGSDGDGPGVFVRGSLVMLCGDGQGRAKLLGNKHPNSFSKFCCPYCMVEQRDDDSGGDLGNARYDVDANQRTWGTD